MKGKPTKPIVRTLITEYSVGSHFTYEKEFLNSRKNTHFYKTNHPGFTASVRQPSRLVKTNGKPTKPIVRERAVELRKNNPLLQNESPHLRPCFSAPMASREDQAPVLLSLDGRGTR
jgi:hypothetical protein